VSVPTHYLNILPGFTIWLIAALVIYDAEPVTDAQRLSCHTGPAPSLSRFDIDCLVAHSVSMFE